MAGLARRSSEGPAARIVDVELGKGLDVIVRVERASRQQKQLWVLVEVLDPVDEVLCKNAQEVPRAGALRGLTVATSAPGFVRGFALGWSLGNVYVDKPRPTW